MFSLSNISIHKFEVLVTKRLSSSCFRAITFSTRFGFVLNLLSSINSVLLIALHILSNIALFPQAITIYPSLHL